MSDEVVFPVGEAILAAIFGIPAVLPFLLLDWIFGLSEGIVVLAYVGGGILLTKLVISKSS